MTLRDSLIEGEKRLDEAGVETPRVDAEWAMAELCGLGRSELALHGAEELTSDQTRRWEEFLLRRCHREPLQYILGTAHFGDLRLSVDGRSLIPRSETEELVALAAARRSGAPPTTVLDLGTGSGACILALGMLFPGAALTATDRDPAALAAARENVQRSGFGSRVFLIFSDWFENLRGRWDLIVSNPPYLSAGEWAEAPPEVRLHEPRMALVSGDGGMADLKKILSTAIHFLTPGGLLALEMGPTHGQPLREFATAQGFTSVEVVRDLAGRERFLFAERGPH
jgi:release factor glutamine methyltransferase